MAGHDVTATAMANGAHGFGLPNAPPSPESDTVNDNTTIMNSKLPYTLGTAGGLQCTSCHNVHNFTNRPFNLKTTVGALCDSCHKGRMFSDVGTSNSHTLGTVDYSTHPVAIPVADLAGNGPNQIKALAAVSAALKTPLNAVPNYALGGKLTGGDTGNVSCETCHAVHGDSSGTVSINDLLAINNYAGTNTDNNALCGGCHYGGKQGLSVGASGTSDHPIDNNAGRAFYPANTALPGVWTGGRIDRTAAVFTLATNGVTRCSSCHDMHGGLDNTSLLRRPIPTAANGQWCFSCHGASTVVPALHHSNTSTLAASKISCSGCHGATYTGGTIQQWAAHNGFGGFSVGPDTNTGTIGTGDLMSVTINSTTYENLCEKCHDPRNPTAVNPNGTPPSGMDFSALPARHGVYSGTQTHLTTARTGGIMLIRDTNRTANTYFRAQLSGTDNSWGTVDASTPNYADNQIYSKYANYGGGTPQNPADLGATGAQLVCESCHNLLTNAGTYNANGSGGYAANLLVYKYEDDGSGNKGGGTPLFGANGDSLCRGCHSSSPMTVTQLAAPPVASAYVHYPEAHTTNTNLYRYTVTPYGRTTNVILTTPMDNSAPCPEETTADATGAPGNFSYQADNRLNCDSCHRPHNAEVLGTNGLGFSAGTQDTFEAYVLEPGTVTTDNQAKTQACTQCHANRATDQWHCLD